MTTPLPETPAPDESACCHSCCADGWLTEIDGELLCDPCLSRWVRAQEPDEDAIDELRRGYRNAGVYEAARIEQAIYDLRGAYLDNLDKGARVFARSERRREGRAA